MESTGEYPRVEYLTYRISHGPGWDYLPAATADGQLGRFDYRIAEKRATFRPRVRIESEHQAREELAPLLAAWELAATLARGADRIRFVFEHCHVRREPPRPGVVELSGLAVTAMFGDVTVVVQSNEYDKPSSELGWSEMVATLRDRYESMLRGESLHHHGNAMLTRVEREYGNRAGAATALQIEYSVLKALGEVLANRGSPDEVRKFSKDFTGAPLTEAEKEWMRAVLRAILERAARRCAGTLGPAVLTMADLPPR